MAHQRKERTHCGSFLYPPQAGYAPHQDTHKYNVEVFCDYEKDGKPMRGRSQVTIVPSQSEQEVLTLLKEAKHAASFAGNPYYELT